MKKLKLIIVFLFLSQIIWAQEGTKNSYAPMSYMCYYKLNNYSGTKAVLYAMRGSQSIALDTARVQLNAFVFLNIERYPAGMYRIAFDDSIYTEVIFNKEDVVLEADADNVLYTMKVKKSEENKVLFNYWLYAISIRDSITHVRFQRERLTNAGQITNKQKRAFENQIDVLNSRLSNYIEEKAHKNPELFVPVVLRSYLIPSYREYLMDPDNEPYPTERLFYLYHFFDNIDFNDARLLNTRIIYTAISDYMSTFAKPAKTVVYKDIIDRVMNLSKGNEAVYQYSLNLFIQAFENTLWESVFVYLIEEYYLNSYAYNPDQGAYYKKKIETIKQLKPGKKMPNITLRDTSNHEVSLYSVKSKVKMVLIYSSDCSHCKEVMPDILEIYEAYHSSGFEIYAIAIDDSINIWKHEINMYEYPWVSVSDLKGLSSPVIDKYNVWMTPMMFMLNEDNIIMNKPRGMEDIHATILQLLKMKK
ncbi:MAG: redoxin domain-containing protein [Bacteroidales bacterium]|nr:redoxin domain-containing protein [Bacteroidales bacterium]